MNLIIFDLDGTLLDTVDDITTSINLALAEANIPPITKEACMYMLGSGAKVLVERAIQGHDAFDFVLKRYLHHYKQLQHQATKPYDGINELLLKLQELQIPMAVFSNKPHYDTISVINHYFKENLFAYVLGKKQNNQPKPAIDGCREIEEALGIHEKIVYVGDTNVDMETATTAGYYRIAVTWGFRKKHELANYDLMIEHPLALLDYLETL